MRFFNKTICFSVSLLLSIWSIPSLAQQAAQPAGQQAQTEATTSYPSGTGWRVVREEEGRLYVLIEEKHVEEQAIFQQIIDTLCADKDECSIVFGVEPSADMAGSNAPPGAAAGQQ
ncbi:MAG: hypothetical protein MESAZ_02087 [Saezia sanguinis]